jgi:hypothetical protein
MHWQRLSLVVVGGAIVASCASRVAGDANIRCPRPTGEFPPHACAIVRGRAVDRNGQPIAPVGVRVDSVVRERGYAYTSGGARTTDDGRFELTVLRVNEFDRPNVPDTATIEIKAVPDVEPVPGFAAVARAAVRMLFAPMGSQVEPTIAGDILFALP